MNVQELAAYCLSKPYTMETYPFDEVTMVIKVADKMFALIPTDSPSSINVKHNTDEIPTLIEQYEGIKPGYHMSKKHWITIDGNADITREKICSLIDTSYELVIKGLPKKKQVFFQTRYSLVEYNSAEYIEALSLRNEVLRKPLGLSFNKEDIEKEQFNDLHIVAKYNDTIIGCMILSPIDSSTVKMRQVAIHPKYQGIGIGSELVKFAESVCIEKNIQEIVLHARLTAQSFYEHAGYQSIGDIFTEVGIPHIRMRKPV